jgi:lysophospholipase L1-like esterase
MVSGVDLHRFRDHEGKEKTVRYTINSRGFRSGEFSPVKGKNVKRLIVIGGSSTMGVESPDDHTFPARLERRLRRRFPGRKYEVINAGFVGYFSNHLLSIVRGELLSYDPDVILMYASYNDTAHERHITQRPVRSGWSGVLYAVHFQLYRRSLLYITAIEKFSLWRTGNPVPSLGFDDRYRKRFRENIRDLIRVCRSNKVKLIIILQPLALSEGVAEFLSGMSSDELAGLIRSGRFGTQAQALQSVRQKVLLAQLVEFAKTHGLAVVNPLPLFT